MKAEYRHYACRIEDDLVYKGIRALILENELIRVGVLLDKGADIYQFLYKPSDTDFLWRSPAGLVRPDRFTPTKADAFGAFLDSYHGGWQEVLPGGGPVTYRGAELGLHGEVTSLGWDCEILTDTPECVAVRLTVDCIRTPFRLERVMRLVSRRPSLFIEEKVTNLSPEDQEFMWGHHPALGAPFLHEGVHVFVPAQAARTHSPRFASSSILTEGVEFPWPIAEADGRKIDLSRVPGSDGGFSELLYLTGLSAGWYAVLDPEKQLGFGLAWDEKVLPYLWFWQVYGKSGGYPWYDRAYVIALEPWSSIPNNLDEAIRAGNQIRLKGGGSLSVALTATAITGCETVNSVELDGTIR
ncbi:MAG: aldose 1-epimerase [Chloroflexi bacterium]|nr:aldose 1-epimerase [Chloroflexota bacterium]